MARNDLQPAETIAVLEANVNPPVLSCGQLRAGMTVSARRAAAVSPGNRLVAPVGPLGEFHHTVGQGSAHRTRQGTPDQLGVSELHPGPGVAAVEAQPVLAGPVDHAAWSRCDRG